MTRPLNIITEPKIYGMGTQVVHQEELNRFLEDNGVSWTTDSDIGAEVIMETAGRTCYQSFAQPRPGGNVAYLEHILEVAHGSVLEHSVFNYLITGISRSLTHEFVRHRAGMAYSQQSQRFVDESTRWNVIAPPLFLQYPEALPSFRIACEQSFGWYETLIEMFEQQIGMRTTAQKKMIREASRSVLPNACETRLFVTMNGRAFRHFLEMRGSIEADAEIRRLAIALFGFAKTDAPNLFQDMSIRLNDNGQSYIYSEHRKV